MGRLIDPARRQRAKEQSAERKTAILEQARHCLLELPYSEITLELIARRAGSKAGFASMYFTDLHHLAFGILREELDGWFGELDSVLDEAAVGRRAAGSIARRVVATLVSRELLLRLLTAMPAMLEVGLSPTEVFTLLCWHRDRLETAGRALERTFPALGPGGGVSALLELELQVAAVLPLSSARGALAAALADRQHAWLRRDLGTELERWLAARLTRS